MAKKEEEEDIEDPREAMRAFVIEAKVVAFASAYNCVEKEFGDSDVQALSDADLRRIFDAYPKTTGDPLAVYIDEYLVPRGFKMTVSELTGEMVMLVKRKGR